jgi:hypothetical protein
MQANSAGHDGSSEVHARDAGRADWQRFAIFVVGVGILLLAAILGIYFLGDRMPTLTEQGLNAAIDRWTESGIESYVMDLRISGARAGNVHVEVKNGVVIELVRDGQTPRQRRTWDVWSVPGQFDMMQRGLEIAADPQREMHAERGAQVVVRAEFDPRLGYPRAFSQVTLGGGPEFAWKTVRFEQRK